MPDFLSMTPEIRKMIYADILAAIIAKPKFGTLDAAIFHINRQICSEAAEV